MLNSQLIELIKYILFTYLTGFTVYSIFFKKILKENNLFINIAVSWGLGVAIIMPILYLLSFGQKLDWINTKNIDLSLSILLTISIINAVIFYKKICSKFNILNWISMIILLMLLKSIIIDSLISYLIGFDGVAIWFLKAKSFLISSGVWNNIFYSQSGYEYSHKTYPIGLPLLIAGFFRIINFANDQIFQLYLLSFFINCLLIIYGIMRDKLSKLTTVSHLLAIVSLFFIPVFMIYAHNGYADMAISFIFALCMGLFILAENNKNGFSYQLLALIISSSGMLIKNEAIPFFIIFNLIFIFSNYYYSQKIPEDIKKQFTFPKIRIDLSRMTKYIVLLVVLLIPTILWEIFKRKYNLAFYLDSTAIADPVSRIKTILFHIMDEFVRTSYYSLTSVLILLSLLIQTTYLSIKKRFINLLPLIIIVEMFISYIYVYMITTVPLKTQLDSSFERLFLQLLPSIYLVVIYQFKSISKDLGE